MGFYRISDSRPPIPRIDAPDSRPITCTLLTKCSLNGLAPKSKTGGIRSFDFSTSTYPLAPMSTNQLNLRVHHTQKPRVGSSDTSFDLNVVNIPELIHLVL